MTDEVDTFLRELTAQLSPRASASGEATAAAEELDCLLQEIGYETRVQEFEYLRRVASSVVVGPAIAPDFGEIESSTITHSVEGETTGELVFAQKALEGEIGDERLDGKIALIERGIDTFHEKTERAAAAGATAALIFNHLSGSFGGRMNGPDDFPSIPAVGIIREDGLRLLELMEDGVVEVTLSVTKDFDPSRNVIAELPGTQEDGGLVIVGAHYDTVPDTQGANDNGSGMTALISIANRIVDNEYPFTVKLLFFGSEEVGLIGSKHHVQQMSEEERTETIAMINFDVPGSGTHLEVSGVPDLMSAAISVAEQANITLSDRLTRGRSNSDHRPFGDAGIPNIIVTSNDTSRINSTRDTLEFVDPQLVAWAAQVGIGLLDHLSETRLSQ